MDESNSRSARLNFQVPAFGGPPARRDARSGHITLDNINESAIHSYNLASNTSIDHAAGDIPSVQDTHLSTPPDNLSSQRNDLTGGNPILGGWELSLFHRLSPIVYGQGDTGPNGGPSGSIPVLAEGGHDGEIAPVAIQPTRREGVVLPTTSSAVSHDALQHPSPQSVAGGSEPLDSDFEVFLPFPSLPPGGWDEQGNPILNINPSQPALLQPSYFEGIPVEAVISQRNAQPIPQPALPQPALAEPIGSEEIFAEQNHAESISSDATPGEQSFQDFFDDEEFLEPGPTYSEMFPDQFFIAAPSVPMPALVEPAHAMAVNLEHTTTTSPERASAGVTSSGHNSTNVASVQSASSERNRKPIIVETQCHAPGCDARA
ncbi:hypothetical protein GE21DRAFT_5044 [Neurospora crassa]|uniref:Uncharacterized protein n=1 Tax=Neurospora crassa (strain ATCC 24698 / 74-OR23-1A / CBS 708.71 / DSM 1257 / FGSC 987) TaxID=367110 RepID=Q7S3I3_NEUCR|nr:hypothetical protein NCU08260 [Neurospora crassa OR74A]EAA30114.1 hypothetical protein NCU08260 [Neurospora crassa OR74A]KHE86520.1 hypothetical protein GE21DRAFT_5044 [Neurospora crassa]|eukprot:XP_959350.1 hypothetical protein NCU08260 [Neurospora crassa OR74A]